MEDENRCRCCADFLLPPHTGHGRYWNPPHMVHVPPTVDFCKEEGRTRSIDCACLTAQDANPRTCFPSIRGFQTRRDGL